MSGAFLVLRSREWNVLVFVLFSNVFFMFLFSEMFQVSFFSVFFGIFKGILVVQWQGEILE